MKCYDLIQKSYEKLFGTKDSIVSSYIHQQRCEAFIKVATERDVVPLERACEEAKLGTEMMERLAGRTSEEQPEVNNFLLSLRIQAWGDALRDLKPEKCVTVYIRAQTMVANMFGEDHPIMVTYNGNLVSAYT